MKKIISLLLVFIAFESYSQIYVENMNQVFLSGSLREEGNYTTHVALAKVELKGTDMVTYADGTGYFVMSGKNVIITSRDRISLIISAEGYKTLEYDVDPGMMELGVIFMKVNFGDINPITVNDLMPDRPETDNQMISKPGAAALFWGDDPLSKATNFNLGMHGYKMRGYDWRNTEVYLNGASFNDPEVGYAYAGLLKGFINLSNQNTGSTRLVNDKIFYGDIGGYSNIDINPLAMKPRARVSYAFSNSLYTHSMDATYSTGEMASGWALSFYLSGKMGNGFAKGTKYEGMSYLFAAAKEIDDFNKFTFFVAGNPTKRGMQNYSTQQVYDINNNYFNSAWGEQSNNKNARQNIYHQPILSFAHEWEGEISSFNTSLLFTTGNKDETGLNWNNETPVWGGFTDPIHSSEQVRWDSIYTENRNANGRSKYILDSHSADRTTIVLNSVYDLFDWGNIETTAGLEAKIYFGRYNNEVYDLLGGSYWLNVDKFISPPVDPDYYQFDITTPDRKVNNGGKFGYDYSTRQQSYKLWNMWRYYMRSFKFSLGGSASFVSFGYTGNVKNGKVEDSNTKQPNNNFFNYSGKASVAYKLSRGSDIELNAMYAQRAPLFANSYISPRISGELIPDLKNEKILAADINYVYSNTLMDLRISGFYTSIKNQSFVRSYYNNNYLSYINMSVAGLGSTHFGGEASGRFSITKTLKANFAASYGVYKYASDANTLLKQENINELIAVDTCDMKGLFVGNTPQMAFTAGVIYESPINWWAGLNMNYTGQSYSDINPFVLSLADYAGQEKLKGAFTLNFNGGYTFVFGEKKKRALSLNINVQNVLGNKKGLLGAYQPFDLDVTDTRYAYMYGRTMHLMLRFLF